VASPALVQVTALQFATVAQVAHVSALPLLR
jgi:hypothetical protein